MQASTVLLKQATTKGVAPVLALLLAAQQTGQTLAAPPVAPIPQQQFFLLEHMAPLTPVNVSTIFNPTTYNPADVVSTAASFGDNGMIALGVIASFGAGLFVLGLKTLYKAKPR